MVSAMRYSWVLRELVVIISPMNPAVNNCTPTTIATSARKKNRLVGHVAVHFGVLNVYGAEFLPERKNREEQAGQEGKKAQRTEKVHRALAEFGNEGNGKQIQKTENKPFQSELGYAVLARTVLYLFFTDFIKTTPFGQYRDVTVHFAVQVNAFDYSAVVGF